MSVPLENLGAVNLAAAAWVVDSLARRRTPKVDHA